MSNPTTPPPPAPVVASVKSPFESKTNWILLISATLDILNEITPIVPFLPAKYQHVASVVIGAIGAVLGIVSKTFFTTSISSYSVPSAAPLAAVLQGTTGPAPIQTAALDLTKKVP